MRVRATTDSPTEANADTIVIGVFEDEGVAHDYPGVLQSLVDAGHAKRGFRKLAVTHAEGRRYVLAGLGGRNELTPERARVVAAGVLGRVDEVGAKSLCWEVPHHVDDRVVGALVEGTVLAAYTYTAYKSTPPEDEGVEELILSSHHDVSAPVAEAALVADSVNAARDLQNAPGNAMTPTALAARARELEGVSVEVLDRQGLLDAGMGAFAAVAQGSEEEPQLIAIRYEPADVAGPILGLVGKAVTFDSGGISLKPGQKMSEMKFDMSGGAAVLEATGAIARLGLPVRVVSVIGATENLPSGRAYKPGDILRASNGTTIEVVNTDAEGRLVLADCLAHAVELGAERLVDLATLTGAMTVALGKTYAGVMGTDDDWCDRVIAAGERTGEICWRLPLHEEYAKAIEGKYADIANAVETRLAGSLVAAEFLKRFTGDVPWAHVDIAGTAWDLGRAYAPKNGSGWGVRMLVELARANEDAPNLH